jgi:L-threonylcarbamoyladenylate synthase
MAELGTNIEKARQLLENDQLVGIPTETVYGLAGNALNANAVARIFTIKGRPHFDPLIVHVRDIEHAAQWVESISPASQALANAFWPGPLTLLFQKKPVIPDLVTSGLNTVGIRCPNHPLTRELLHQLDFPLAAPSANPFGYISPTRAEHVNEQLGAQIPYILDGGPCKVGIESTIIGFDEGKPRIFRVGALPIEAIEKIIGPVTVEIDSTDRPVAPGQLLRHYSPTKKFVLGNITELLEHVGNRRAGALTFSSAIKGIDPDHQRMLSSSGNLEEAAKNLFAAMRELDKLEVDVILAEEVPDEGIGMAINDRLRRAAVSEE